MSRKIKLKRIFISWDFFGAAIFASIYGYLVNSDISADIVKNITALAVTTLSIIFSVYFAALAVLITSVDNEFKKFLQSFNAYTELIWSFKFTFLLIFLALTFSIILYVTSLFEMEKNIPGVYPLGIMVPYIFITIYSLFCTVSSSLDAIKYAEYRTKHALITKQVENNEDK